MRDLINEPFFSPFSEFDRLLNAIAAAEPSTKVVTNKQKNCICNSQFPHSDISEDENKNLVIEAQLPGWKECELKTSFKNDYFILRGEKEPVELKRKYFQRGIKKVNEFEIKFFVDPRRYDAHAKSVSFKFEDGVLVVVFPRSKNIVEDLRYGFGSLSDEPEKADVKEDKAE